MTWLDNPIAHLWGPYFLALYAMVLAIMLAIESSALSFWRTSLKPFGFPTSNWVLRSFLPR